MTRIVYPCGCEGSISYFFIKDSYYGMMINTIMGEKDISSFNNLDKVCDDHKYEAKHEFFEQIKKENEKRILLSENFLNKI